MAYPKGQENIIMAKLELATCQFPVVKDVKQNLVYALRQIKQARGKGADLVHFPECCLSGYFGVELKSLRDANWDVVADAMTQVMAAAKQWRVWPAGARRLRSGLYAAQGERRQAGEDPSFNPRTAERISDAPVVQTRRDGGAGEDAAAGQLVQQGQAVRSISASSR
jgi:hypothetical protein